jgi:ABC-type lipopolysaccharide export system ATPase subunit
MLLVEQNAEMALLLADRVYVIDHGTVVFEGTPAQLRADAQVTATYLGVQAAAVAAAPLLPGSPKAITPPTA